MTQTQHWPGFDRVIISDTEMRASVQIEFYNEPCEDGTTAYLYALWVNKDWRDSGYATRLMEEAERIAKERGHKEIVLDYSTWEAPQWVKSWYERRGYEEWRFKSSERGTIYYLKKKL